MIDLQTQRLIIALVIIAMTSSVVYIVTRIIRELQAQLNERMELLRGGHPLDR